MNPRRSGVLAQIGDALESAQGSRGKRPARAWRCGRKASLPQRAADLPFPRRRQCLFGNAVRPAAGGKLTCEIRMRLKASTRKARELSGVTVAKCRACISPASEMTPLILPMTVLRKRTRSRNRGFFVGGNFVKDGRFQNLRGMIVIFGGVNHGARSTGGGFLAKSLRQDAMNAAGPRPGIETDAGHGGGDFFRFGHRIHQTREILAARRDSQSAPDRRAPLPRDRRGRC